MKIKNWQDIALSKERELLLSVLEKGFEAIDPKKAIQDKIKLKEHKLQIQNDSIDLKDIDKIYLVGIGKAGLKATKALRAIIKSYQRPLGLVLDIKKEKIPGIQCFAGTHPLPSIKNQKATAKILELLKKAGPKDLVIFIISGGGTVLLTQPKNITPHQEAKVIKCLFQKGATIQQMNTLRKHLSLARGGNLAKAAFPAKVISLIFSDVPGDDLQFIASGPTIQDKTTLKDAKEIIKKFDLERCSQVNLKKALIETPKESKYFKKVKNILFISNQSALKAMAHKAQNLGLKAKIMTSNLKGEAREVAKKILKDLAKEKPKTLLLYGGETTVNIKGQGRGGRNQELVLSALLNLKPNEIVIAVASDGIDNTPFAGAISDKITLIHTLSKKLDPKIYLNNNDSYSFFKKSGDFIKTGPTGSNVSDLILAAKF